MSESMTEPGRTRHRVSIVIPVWPGEHARTALVEELVTLNEQTPTQDGIAGLWKKQV